VIKNIGAIAQGMGITLKEMFQPPSWRIIPTAPGPLRERVSGSFAGSRVANATKTRLGICCVLFVRRGLSCELYLHPKPPKTRHEKRVSGASAYPIYKRLQSMYLLRIVRGSLSDGCDHSRPWI